MADVGVAGNRVGDRRVVLERSHAAHRCATLRGMTGSERFEDAREQASPDAQDEGRARSLISFGADLAGALGGLAVREEARVGAALGLIELDAERRKADREEPRRDGFFDDRGTLRPDAVDLLEGVLREAADAYEERKVPLFARLFSETAHRSSVSGAEAPYYVRLTSALTYRQLVILSAYAAAPEEIGGANGLDPEVDDLGERHLLGIVDDDGVPGAPGRFSGRVDGGTATRASATAEETASEAARSALGLTRPDRHSSNSPARWRSSQTLIGRLVDSHALTPRRAVGLAVLYESAPSGAPVGLSPAGAASRLRGLYSELARSSGMIVMVSPPYGRIGSVAPIPVGRWTTSGGGSLASSASRARATKPSHTLHPSRQPRTSRCPLQARVGCVVSLPAAPRA